MVAIAIFSTDPVQRSRLEDLLRVEPAVTLVGIGNDPSALLRVIAQNRVDVVLADAPSRDQLSDWRRRHGQMALVVLLDGTDPEDGLEPLLAGAGAILPRFAERDAIVAAITAVANGLVVLPRHVLAGLLDGALPDEASDGSDGAATVQLTPRELEVLAAMADGASNKVIARRLDISFHTAKFHV
ncbi:MAG TPA: LuxR C-terminal-related transcriptional regulator, partial [Xanthobacteraceae bacterium]|nr:LuxR C-terminal-related transcriptional regulator [Xanthobacteraceae bacterium]